MLYIWVEFRWYYNPPKYKKRAIALISANYTFEGTQSMSRNKGLIVLLLISSLLSPSINTIQANSSFNNNSGLFRGINLGNALEAPNEGDWGVQLTQNHFKRVNEAGFDFVRVPIRWSAHASYEEPFTISENFFERIDWVINQSYNQNLSIIINIHHYGQIMSDPISNKDRFLSIWQQIAERFQNHSEKLYFELLNEPTDNLTNVLWNQYLVEAINVIRETNPIRKIIVGPTNWNNLYALDDLILPGNDTNIIVTFHYYSPFHFTHQGAEWVEGSNDWLGTTWSGTTEEMNAIRTDLDVATQWAYDNNKTLLLGEFGAYSKADLESRVRWTSFVAREAEKRNISWAYWELCSGFGIIDGSLDNWNFQLLEALIPISSVLRPALNTGNIYTITSKVTGQGALVNSTADGANVFCDVLYSFANNFRWQLVKHPYKPGYMIISLLNMKLWEVEGASTSEDASIQTNSMSRINWEIPDYRLFIFEEDNSSYFYRIKNYETKLYVSRDSNGNIVQKSSSENDSLLWKLTLVTISSPHFDNLVWADEFNYLGFPNSTYWSFEQTFVNNELQFYTVEDADNCWISNGTLKITARKEAMEGFPYTSARIQSHHKMEILYGQVEARIKVAGGNGTWPAFWMLGTDIDTIGWPKCGEIDILEYVGFDPYSIHGNAHTELYNGMDATNIGASVNITAPWTDWHVYGVKWSQERIVWYVDNREYFVYENIGQGKDQYPFTSSFYIILNLAIGGTWGGIHGIDDLIFPVTFEVDFVRVYQESTHEDTTPPEKVIGLDATVLSDSQVYLFWMANMENDIDHYNVYRNDFKITEITSTTFNDLSLNANTTYTYEVSAVDTSGNEGARSDPVIITTESMKTTSSMTSLATSSISWTTETTPITNFTSLGVISANIALLILFLRRKRKKSS